jgi:glycosyltransferase involved in cell wall biosynthesis
MKKISIIVPVYNAEKYISDCITSILNQTYSYFELLLIDDGSTDMSGKICDDFNYKDNRIKVIHKENGGVSSARNIGIEASSGDYIIFIDSDDSINKNMVDELVSALDKYEVETIVHTIGYKRNEKSKKMKNSL